VEHPVVRLTVLGLRGVPETIREAAIAYGASKWYLLRKVDLAFGYSINISRC
jgi:glycine betaine/proline transport system permease protein